MPIDITNLITSEANGNEGEGERTMWDLSDRVSEVDAQRVHEVIGDTEDALPGRWNGHDMDIRMATTGARIATLNTQRKLYGNTLHWEMIYDLMQELSIDIMVLTEPGKSDEMRMAAMKNWAIEKQIAADVINRSHTTNGGGDGDTNSDKVGRSEENNQEVQPRACR